MITELSTLGEYKADTGCPKEQHRQLEGVLRGVTFGALLSRQAGISELARYAYNTYASFSASRRECLEVSTVAMLFYTPPELSVSPD
jgi:hypothetical protein